jgi:hemerythrin-like metal-binding protein
MFDVFRRYKPSWLYELLPYGYAGAGVLTILLLRNGVALFSGILLVTAGGMIWYMRKSYRRSGRAGIPSGRTRPGAVDIVWHADYESGNKQIDNQHIALFAVANVLLDEIGNHEPAEVINHTLKGLIRDIQVHFRDEEQLLERIAPALSSSHKVSHVRLLREAHRLSDRLAGGTASMSELAGFVVYDMIANHLANEDKLYLPALRRTR